MEEALRNASQRHWLIDLYVPWLLGLNDRQTQKPIFDSESHAKRFCESVLRNFPSGLDPLPSLIYLDWWQEGGTPLRPPRLAIRAARDRRGWRR